MDLLEQPGFDPAGEMRSPGWLSLRNFPGFMIEANDARTSRDFEIRSIDTVARRGCPDDVLARDGFGERDRSPSRLRASAELRFADSHRPHRSPHRQSHFHLGVSPVVRPVGRREFHFDPDRNTGQYPEPAPVPRVLRSGLVPYIAHWPNVHRVRPERVRHCEPLHGSLHLASPGLRWALIANGVTYLMILAVLGFWLLVLSWNAPPNLQPEPRF
jgi:hypothetical protein